MPPWYYQCNTNVDARPYGAAGKRLENRENGVAKINGIKPAWILNSIGTILARNWSADKTTG
jgi:hypothetical protein